MGAWSNCPRTYPKPVTCKNDFRAGNPFRGFGDFLSWDLEKGPVIMHRIRDSHPKAARVFYSVALQRAHLEVSVLLKFLSSYHYLSILDQQVCLSHAPEKNYDLLKEHMRMCCSIYFIYSNISSTQKRSPGNLAANHTCVKFRIDEARVRTA